MDHFEYIHKVSRGVVLGRVYNGRCYLDTQMANVMSAPLSLLCAHPNLVLVTDLVPVSNQHQQLPVVLRGQQGEIAL